MTTKHVAYYRVSTKRQGESGLGLEAQREAVRKFVGSGMLVAEFEEVESGKRNDRPELEAALRECRLRGAKLIIAKLDRLSRSVTFISKLMDEKVDFSAVDMPTANTLTVNILAATAQFEREMTSQRTKAALQAAKARGTVLGGRRGDHKIEDHSSRGRQRSMEVRSANADALANDRRQVIDAIRAEGVTSLRGIARVLNERSILTARGGQWSAGQVARVEGRI